MVTSKLRPYVQAVARASDCLNADLFGKGQLSALRMVIADLAAMVGIPVFQIPHKVCARSLAQARGDYWRAIDAWLSDPDSLSLYLAQDRAAFAFNATLGKAATTAYKPRLMRPGHALDPEHKAYRAPVQAVLDLCHGSAVMAGRVTHDRVIHLDTVRAASVLAARRGKRHYTTRRQIAELLAECEAMHPSEVQALLC